MLSLQLKSGEYLTIGDDIVVQVFEQGGTIRVAVKAPRELPILRGEVHERDGQRPDGLLRQRPKTPSERVRNARRMEELARKKETAADCPLISRGPRGPQEIDRASNVRCSPAGWSGGRRTTFWMGRKEALTLS